MPADEWRPHPPAGSEKGSPVPSETLGHNRDFRLLWLAQALTTTGLLAAVVAVPLFVLGTTGSAADAGLVGFCVLATTAVATLPGGQIVDRHDRRTVLVCCTCGSAVAMGLLAVMVHVGAATMPVVLVLTAAEGALRGTLGSAGVAALSRVVPAERLSTALAANYARLAVAGLIGPMVAGGLFELAPELPFAVAALGLLVATVCVMAIRTPLPAPTTRGPVGLVAGLTFLWRDGIIRRFTLVQSVHNTVFSTVPLLVAAVGVWHHTSSLSIGLVYVLTGAGSLLGAITAATVSRRLSPWAAILIVCWVPAVLLALSAAMPSLGVLAVALTVGSFVSPPADAVLGAARLLRTPDALQGRAQAAVSLVAMGMTPLGPPMAGLLIDHTSVAIALLVLAVALAALAVAAMSSAQLRALGGQRA